MKSLSKKKTSQGDLSEEFGKNASANHPEIPMVELHPNNNPFKKVKFISPFVSLELSFESERSSPLCLESKLCPSGHQNIVLDSGRDSTLILHDISLENKNFYAMDILLSTECSYEDHNLLLIFVRKLFRRMVVYAFIYHKYCKSRSYTMALTLQLEQKC